MSVNVDPERVIGRTAQLAGTQLGSLLAELGMAREVIDVQATRIGELEKAAEEQAAELARAHQANAALQQRTTESAGDPEAPQAT